MRLLSRLFHHDLDDFPDPEGEVLIPKTPKPHVHLVPAECEDPDCWFCSAKEDRR